jgi:ABC-type amino acid transport substrate-binding protein
VFRSHPQPELRVEAYAEIKEERSLKKGFCVLALFTFSAAMSVSAYSQTASPSAASTQGETPELRVAAFVAPPSVMEQNGTLTGFSVDLWNAIVARLKAKTSRIGDRPLVGWTNRGAGVLRGPVARCNPRIPAHVVCRKS